MKYCFIRLMMILAVILWFCVNLTEEKLAEMSHLNSVSVPVCKGCLFREGGCHIAHEKITFYKSTGCIAVNKVMEATDNENS